MFGKNIPRYLTEERNRKQDVLLKATADLFRNHEYDEITMRQLCTEAGIGFGSFFDYVMKRQTPLFRVRWKQKSGAQNDE